MLIQTSKMNKSNVVLFLKIFTTLQFLLSATANADIYVDLSKSDSISIVNISDENNYTFKITEPVLTITNQELAVINNKDSEEIKNLPFNNEVILAANMTGIEPALIHAVITVESQHNPHAQSVKGAYGLMQLMPETSRRFNVLDKNNPKQNILAGAKYLQELLKLFNGDLKLTLAAYNAGPAAVQRLGGKIPPFKETVNYVPKVLKYYKKYS